MGGVCERVSVPEAAARVEWIQLRRIFGADGGGRRAVDDGRLLRRSQCNCVSTRGFDARIFKMDAH